LSYPNNLDAPNGADFPHEDHILPKCWYNTN